ncbi:type 1 glutamine amidotransferase domain-containing protein [Millisia brevis]|uniref:type 1 glutamine amidotransferase domain-containing protein n=1 Tax=Millisia brevis TaxID=264148 RepID=UPI0008321C4F|nr:type 1 glutamine amidotransferase domain-containing protein [Millisia brevis]
MSSALFVVTEVYHADGFHSPTGFDIREAAEVWDFLTVHGFDVEFASLGGGTVEGVLKSSPSRAIERFNRAFDRPLTVPTIAAARAIDQPYEIVYFVGGIGAMWDFPTQPALHALIESAEARRAVVAAICHGPAAFLGLRRSDGSPWVQDLQITSFSDNEERNRGVLDLLPFSLQQALESAGATVLCAADRASNVVRDDLVITAQNPTSIAALESALIDALRPIGKGSA